jgi:hypothetical protein
MLLPDWKLRIQELEQFGSYFTSQVVKRLSQSSANELTSLYESYTLPELSLQFCTASTTLTKFDANIHGSSSHEGRQSKLRAQNEARGSAIFTNSFVQTICLLM